MPHYAHWPQVHRLHIVNIEQRQAPAAPQTIKSVDLGCESLCSMLLRHSHVLLLGLYSTRRLILPYRPTDDRTMTRPTVARAHSSTYYTVHRSAYTCK